MTTSNQKPGINLKALAGIALAVVVLAGIVWHARSRPTAPAPKNTEVPVGLVIPLTGNASNYGDIMRRGVDLAVDMDRQEHGDSSVRVIYEDSKGTPKDGVLASQKVILQDKTPVIVSAFSGILLAIAPIAEKAEVVLINGPANSPKLRNASPYLFNMAVLSDSEGAYLADATAKRCDTADVAFFHLNSEFGISFMESFEKRYQELGGKLVLREPHEQNASDFRESILKAKALGVKVAAVASYYKETALLIKQARESDFTPQWVTYSGVEAPEFLTLSAGAAEGMIYTQPGLPLDTDNSTIKAFTKAYREKYSKDPDAWSAQFYDIGRLLCWGARQGAKTGPEFRDVLQKTDGAFSVTGFRGFDADRCVNKHIQVKTVKNGAFQLLE